MEIHAERLNEVSAPRDSRVQYLQERMVWQIQGTSSRLAPGLRIGTASSWLSISLLAACSNAPWIIRHSMWLPGTETTHLTSTIWQSSAPSTPWLSTIQTRQSSQSSLAPQRFPVRHSLPVSKQYVLYKQLSLH